MSETSSWIELVRRIVAEVSRSDATEVELSQGTFRLRLRRRPGVHGETEPAQAAPDTQAQDPANLLRVVAPLSGIFYRRPSPNAALYVEEGDWVEPQTVVGLIETMKVFNEVTADVAGRVVSIHVQSGQLVQTGETLLSVEPAEGPRHAPEVMS